MPTVIVEGPRASEETKKELVKRITEVVREVYGVKHVSIIIHEVDVENVGVDGELLSDILKKKSSSAVIHFISDSSRYRILHRS